MRRSPTPALPCRGEVLALELAEGAHLTLVCEDSSPHFTHCRAVTVDGETFHCWVPASIKLRRLAHLHELASDPVAELLRSELEAPRATQRRRLPTVAPGIAARLIVDESEREASDRRVLDREDREPIDVHDAA